MIFDIRTGKEEKFEDFGIDFEIRKNQYLYEDFMVSAKKPDTSEKCRFLVNLTKKLQWQSNLDTIYYNHFDVAYSDMLKRAIEVTKISRDEEL